MFKVKKERRSQIKFPFRKNRRQLDQGDHQFARVFQQHPTQSATQDSTHVMLVHFASVRRDTI